MRPQPLREIPEKRLHPEAATASTLTPSTPGAPRFVLTLDHARHKTSMRWTWPYRAWNRRSGSCLAQRYSVHCKARTLSRGRLLSDPATPSPRRMDLAATALIRAPPCSRNASMKQRPFAPGGLCCPADHHYYGPLRLPLDSPPLPGSAGYRRATLPGPHARGRGGPLQFPGQPSDRSTPLTPGGS